LVCPYGTHYIKFSPITVINNCHGSNNFWQSKVKDDTERAQSAGDDVIGPLMFLVYINELAAILDCYGIKIKIFADDAKLMYRLLMS